MATYRIAPGGQVTLTLSAAECKGLVALANLGNNLMEDQSTLGNSSSQAAAWRAVEALNNAAREAGYLTKGQR